MKLGELADIRMGYSFRSRVEPDRQGDAALIQMKDIGDANDIDVAGADRFELPPGKSHHLLQPGDLLFRSRGRSNGAALVGESIGVAVLAAPMLVIRPHGVLPEFLAWFINAPPTQAQMAALAEGTSVKMISAEALKELDVPLPPPRVQHAIAQAAELAAHEQQLIAEISRRRQRLADHHFMTIAHKATP